jgi:hypothetical protein
LVPEECQVLVVCGKEEGLRKTMLCTVCITICTICALMRHELCGMSHLNTSSQHQAFSICRAVIPPRSPCDGSSVESLEC